MKFTAALVAFVLALGASAHRIDAQQPRTILITGSNRGLGLEFTKQYAAAGWNVIATARDVTGAKELRALASGNPRITLEKLDLLDRPGIKALAAKYRGRPIDVLLNNGGLLGDMKAQQLGSLDDKQFEEVMAVNVSTRRWPWPKRSADSVAGEHTEEDRVDDEPVGDHLAPGYRGPYYYRASRTGLNMVTRDARRRPARARHHRRDDLAAADGDGHAAAR